MPRFVAESVMFRKETAIIREVAEKSKANVDVFGGLQKKVWDVTNAVAELTPVVKKAQDVRVDAENNVCSWDVKSSMFERKEALFDAAMIAVNKESSATIVECVSSRWH